MNKQILFEELVKKGDFRRVELSKYVFYLKDTKERTIVYEEKMIQGQPYGVWLGNYPKIKK